jgi:peptidoglycan/xylan/chitin deacetylase (PgdA/CDA1 family)
VFQIARQLGLDPVMWNITGHDWNAPSPEYVQEKVGPRIRGGDIILLHDGGHAAFGTDRSATVMAVDRLITRFVAEGFEFVTVPKMMGPRLTLADGDVRRSTIT